MPIRCQKRLCECQRRCRLKPIVMMGSVQRPTGPVNGILTLIRHVARPRRKKLMTTSQYIYRTLFLEGQNSDVTIVALGIDWCLHKVYLCQSPYFASMFCGDWKEKEEGVVEVGIEDPRITCDALKIVFGSLYLDEIVIEPGDVIPVLATATLFQLDELIQLCSEIMEETIKLDTVISYYEVAEQYALTRLKQKCFEWLERNLTFLVNEDARTLRQISPGLMEQLVKSPRLVVVQTEFSLYLMVTAWTFLREHPSWEGDLKECALEAHKYFRTKSGDCFTQCEEGQEYTEVYQGLRIEHLINHPLDVRTNLYIKRRLSEQPPICVDNIGDIVPHDALQDCVRPAPAFIPAT
ncbi:hypothetical protein HPB49_021726 [Dermacentor silvarum]|uniref:Uncharacterized protein n=1 Tax=Dermacentor silvarum TaxID=543639 RepID=A0ACB8E3B0_DERSI|nr:hypothetical protein HPB49_021726 [Dermacentor silvarum]